jgi:hypothetical protein
MLSFLLIIPGVLAAYFVIARPLLHKIPRFAAFYAQADTIWAKVWALCGKSVTVLWGLIVGAVGSAFELSQPLATALGEQDIKTQVMNALQAHPEYIAYFTMFVSVVTIVARLRSLLKV